MEDMCQLTERQIEQKYLASYERVAKAIIKIFNESGIRSCQFFRTDNPSPDNYRERIFIVHDSYRESGYKNGFI